MVGRVKTLQNRLLDRRCVVCGFDGPALNNGRVDECPGCGCDLLVRPARSYAEMEGLIGQPLTIDSPFADGRQERFISRWLAFFFMSSLVVLTILYLTAEALAI